MPTNETPSPACTKRDARTLAVLACAYLAADYLARDAERDGDEELIFWFRHRALAAGIAIGGVAIGGIVVLQVDAPHLPHGLTGSRTSPGGALGHRSYTQHDHAFTGKVEGDQLPTSHPRFGSTFDARTSSRRRWPGA